MSSVKEIRLEHERLENMKTTQSAKIVNELKSDAHKHRGILLEEIDRLEAELASALEEIDSLEDEVEEFWGDVPEIPVMNGANTESGS